MPKVNRARGFSDVNDPTVVEGTGTKFELYQVELKLRALLADGDDDGVVALLIETLPGAELGYAERETDYTTTNTSISSTTAGVIDGGFSVGPIVGTGRPVDIEFHAPQVRHTTASIFVLAYLLVNGVAQGPDGQNSVGSSPQTTVGRELTLKRRLVLTEGVSYTFTIGICGGGGGTCTIDGADGTAIHLSVVSR